MIKNVGCIQRLCQSWVKLIHGAHVVHTLENDAVRESMSCLGNCPSTIVRALSSIHSLGFRVLGLGFKHLPVRSGWEPVRSALWSPNAFKISVNNPAADGDNSAHTLLSRASAGSHSVYSSVVRHGRPIRPEQHVRAPVSARGVSKDCTPKHHDCAQIALSSNKIALRLHSKTPQLRSDCTLKQQDCAQIALSSNKIALRLQSQATRLRSDCTPKHHDCAQIALSSNKIALRLHSQATRLRSDCNLKQQDCAQIALQNTTTALRLHSQATRLRSDCTPKYRNCTPTALQKTKIAIPKIDTALRAIARSGVVRQPRAI